MAPAGRIVLLAALEQDGIIPLAPLVSQGLRIEGSLVAPRHCVMEMLEYAARNNIRPAVQKFPLDTEGIQEALTLLKKGSVRYRAVLVPERDAIEA